MHKFTVGIFATVNEEILCSCHILLTIFFLPNLISRLDPRGAGAPPPPPCTLFYTRKLGFHTSTLILRLLIIWGCDYSRICLI